jgi:hypothetical protein
LQKIIKDLEENNYCNQALNRIRQKGLIHLFKEYELKLALDQINRNTKILLEQSGSFCHYKIKAFEKYLVFHG